jgi:hypothetical protein
MAWCLVLDKKTFTSYVSFVKNTNKKLIYEFTTTLFVGEASKNYKLAVLVIGFCA